MITARVTYRVDNCDHFLDEDDLKELLKAESVKVLLESHGTKRVTLREYANRYCARYFNMFNREANRVAHLEE